MDFFDSRDWLNRQPPYAFRIDHILAIIIGLGIGVFLALFLKKKDKKITKWVTISLWIFEIVVASAYYIGTYIVCIVDPIGHPFIIDEMLPFHSCLMFTYIFPLAMFAKNKYIKLMANNFIVVVNMIIGFITLFVGCPPVGHSALSFAGFQSLVIHIIIVIVPLILIVTNYYDIQKGDLKYGLFLFGILSLIMWIFDAIAGCDYFYFYDGHTFPVFKVISENVPHIVWTLIVLTCYTLSGVIIHYLIIFIKSFLKKKANEKLEKENG